MFHVGHMAVTLHGRVRAGLDFLPIGRAIAVGIHVGHPHAEILLAGGGREGRGQLRVGAGGRRAEGGPRAAVQGWAALDLVAFARDRQPGDFHLDGGPHEPADFENVLGLMGIGAGTGFGAVGLAIAIVIGGRGEGGSVEFQLPQVAHAVAILIDDGDGQWGTKQQQERGES